eukprot:TRINITY_DN87666_c0_g1_i1.p1 TRINITY_DN87666_c0_g1~~TRINITY_DN87666_c0_g1_i1.p1  ORF type:complete len:495 (-),score=78.18 TRINITY_DN87666_c0_g1_i1:158-1642(-)
MTVPSISPPAGLAKPMNPSDVASVLTRLNSLMSATNRILKALPVDPPKIPSGPGAEALDNAALAAADFDREVFVRAKAEAFDEETLAALAARSMVKTREKSRSLQRPRRRSPSLQHSRNRSLSARRSRQRSSSPQRSTHRPASPERSRHRSPSPQRARYQPQSPQQSKHRPPSPQRSQQMASRLSAAGAGDAETERAAFDCPPSSHHGRAASNRTPTPERPSRDFAEQRALDRSQSRRRAQQLAPGPAATAALNGEQANKQQAGDAASEYAVGHKVQYWSESKKRWLETDILKVIRRTDGTVIAYDLACKPNVQADKLKQMQQDSETSVERKRSLAESNEPSLTGLRAKWKQKREVENGEDMGKAEETKPIYRVGQQVEFFSKSLNDYMPTQVIAYRKYKGACFYDLACKRGVEESKIRPSRSALAVAAVNASSVSGPASDSGAERNAHTAASVPEATTAAAPEASNIEGAWDRERYAKRPRLHGDSEERRMRT